MNNDHQQAALAGLAQTSPAYDILLRDYVTYHAVLVAEGSVVALLLIGLSVYCWRRYRKSQQFERRAYFGGGLLSGVVALALLLLVAVNLSTVVNPHAGFAQIIADLAAPRGGASQAVLHRAVASWAQSGGEAMPSPLEDAVRRRLSWQRPKALVSSVLLVVCAVLTAGIWRRLIRRRAGVGRWSLSDRALLTIGVLTVPATLTLLLMALANTQAALAPITLTLLYG
jgi:hypothetical protein